MLKINKKTDKVANGPKWGIFTHFFDDHDKTGLFLIASSIKSSDDRILL
jgi:hypothetical protein